VHDGYAIRSVADVINGRVRLRRSKFVTGALCVWWTADRAATS
jgi:hypothetical protein